MNTRILLSVLFAALFTVPSAWGAHSATRRAYEPTRYQVEEVQKLAHEVEDRSRLVHRAAERWAHHGSVREERALIRLHELEERARHFRRQIERRGQSLRHSEADFVELRRGYARAAYAMHGLHAYERIDREFSRLSDAMYELEMYAEGLFAGLRPVDRRHRGRYGWEPRHRERSHGRIALPRVRFEWDWFRD